MTDIKNLCQGGAKSCFFEKRWREYVSFMQMTENDGQIVLIMPNINNLRFNYCPACGAHIRDMKIEKTAGLAQNPEAGSGHE